MVPELGVSRPAAICSSVDLPQPDGPTSATSSPCSISRLKPSMTCRPEKLFCISLKDSFMDRCVADALHSWQLCTDFQTVGCDFTDIALTGQQFKRRMLIRKTNKHSLPATFIFFMAMFSAAPRLSGTATARQARGASDHCAGDATPT